MEFHQAVLTIFDSIILLSFVIKIESVQIAVAVINLSAGSPWKELPSLDDMIDI